MRRSRIYREEVQRSKPEAMPPDGHRSEGTLSLSEVPYAGAKPFGLPFRRLEKVTRCKSETASGDTRRNGYAPNPKKPNPVTRSLAKVTRRNGETVISNPRSNGYAPNPKKTKALTHPQAMRSLALSRFFGHAEAKKGTRSKPRLPPQL